MPRPKRKSALPTSVNGSPPPTPAQTIREHRPTAEKLEATPELRDKAIAMLAAGATQQEVCQVLKIGRLTMSAFARKAEADGRIPEYRERMRGKLMALVEDTVDARLASGEVLDGVTWGITFDKLRLLDNEPTEIVDVRDESADRLASALERIRSGRAAAEVVVETIEAEILPAPTPPQLAAAAPSKPQAAAQPRFRRQTP